jgi:hypothetical protein
MLIIRATVPAQAETGTPVDIATATPRCDEADIEFGQRLFHEARNRAVTTIPTGNLPGWQHGLGPLGATRPGWTLYSSHN